MYARVTRVKADPAAIDRQVEQMKAQMLPVFKQQPGYIGAISIANRETGEGATTTYWDSMEHLKASEAAIFAARDKFAAEQGAEIVSVHRCELAVSERKAEPRAGTHLRAVTLRGLDGDKIERVIDRHSKVVAPFVLQQPGCLASLLMVDRENGLAFAISTWESAAKLEAASPAIQAHLDANPSGFDVQTERQTADTTFVELPVTTRTS